MANFRLPAATRNALANAIETLVDQATGSPNAAYVRIYSGTQPANGGDALAGNTLLAELRFSDPAFGAAAAGVITANAMQSDMSADATGTATWARIADGNGVTIFDCDVTASGGGGTIQFATVSFVAAAQIDLTSFTITMPAS